MAIDGISGTNAFLIQSLVDSRKQLDDLQKQLGTGRKSETYQGLGRDVGTDVAFRHQISILDGYQRTIDRVSIRLNVLDDALTHLDGIVRDTRADIDPNNFDLLGGDQTIAQRNAKIALGEALSTLNVQADDRFVFSGRAVDQKPLVELDTILDGGGGLAGLRQVVDERRQADLGTSGLGRLTVGTVTDTVTLAEDGNHAFGFKIDTIQNNLTNVTVTTTAGPPQSEAIQFTGLPADGEALTFELILPDGTRESVTLTATTGTASDGTFQIGATAAATAANFDAAVTAALTVSASTALNAASAVQAGADFFNTAGGQAPQRVDGPPFDTATALRNGSADTVAYYVGDNANDDSRTTSSARIDGSLTVDYGARANEEALSETLQALAVFSAASFSETAPLDRDRYAELSSRIRQNLSFPPGTESITNIHVEIVSVSESVESTRGRHVSAQGMLTQTVEEIQGINLEEVSAQILTLQTRLQASYQTTSILSQLTLTNFI
ncbi:MAG: flagellar biosynthesis protein FlgL [Pseudomonadota bacterium]